MKMNDYETKHLSLLRPHLADCTVLLKTDGSFPLCEPGKIAAFGNGVRHTVKGGTGSGEVNSRFFTTVEKGLEDAGFIITTRDWLDAYDAVRRKAKTAFLADIKKQAKANHMNPAVYGMGAIMPEPDTYIPIQGEGNTAVYVLARISGEGSDRRDKGDVLLTDSEIRGIRFAAKSFSKFILVLNTGGPVDLSPVLDDVGNILVLSQLGAETGAALADILLGRSVPSGKLSTTWAKCVDYCSAGTFGEKDDTLYKEGIYVGYRYFDSVKASPLFPFGFGLSWTTFSLKKETPRYDDGIVSLSCTVSNTGNHAGRETVQVYVSVPSFALDHPYQALAGFAKTKLLNPGESETVTVTFDIRDLAGYDESKEAYVLDCGVYTIRIGNSSRNTEPAGTFAVPEVMIVSQAVRKLGASGFEDWRPETSYIPPETADIVIDHLSHSDRQKTEESCDPYFDSVSEEDLIRMNIGAYDPDAGMLSVIGSAAMHVAGAAGETCSALADKGVPALVMADGPAGLRLSRQYFINKEGKAVSIGSSMPETILELLPLPVQLLMKLIQAKPGKTDEIKEQYATAIPIGTALAQSFDPELAKLCGDIVGCEMERFGVHLWLAPAFNIHRNIHCGRNFEYFSEDPLLSAVIAAGLIKGVESHPHCGTVIKHFAANNQETNRYANNSCLSERALREIYLRAFEKVIRDACPAAVMTSYNLINGIHTSEHKGLVQGILRDEWGYQGVVMTDWVIGATVSQDASYAQPNAAKVAAASNDLFMPGSARDYEEIRQGLADGTVTKEQLIKNATRVRRLALKLAGKDHNG